MARTVRRAALTAAAILITLDAAVPRAQPVFRGSEIFPAGEFAARRTAVLEKIGDGIAIVLGTTEPAGEMPFRQNSQCFYLTGVTEPRAAVIIDGRTRQTTVFLQPANERRDRSMYGPSLAPGAEAARELGVEAVLPYGEFGAAVTGAIAAHRRIYTPHAAEVLGSQSQGDPTRMWNANRQDPWDGRDSREATFIARLKAAGAAPAAPAAAPVAAAQPAASSVATPPPPASASASASSSVSAPASETATIVDLDPIVNALRAVKSAREIAVIREATQIAGAGIMQAMRDTRPGLHEYELQASAEYVFKKAGALGASYFALIATGPNSYYTHYNRNTAVLKDGELVQFDYAPDFKYYQSDVTRVFPVNGRFTPRQREMYGIYLKLYQALLTSIDVHKTPAEVMTSAVRKMDGIMASYPFTDDRIKAAAAAMVDAHRARKSPRGLGHNVGLEVHDVGGLQSPTFEPGRIFTIEPQMRLEGEHLGIRLEDMILITDTGYENLSAFVPIEIADIERLMRQPQPPARRR